MMGSDLDPDLVAALDRVARVPHLMVASDYDGTLAPIVTDPSRAFPLPDAIAALADLVALPHTSVAVISGRARGDLAALARLPAEVHLVGSHGSEFDTGFVDRLSPDRIELRERLLTELEAITAGRPGVRLETKPASVTVHTRTAAPEVGAEVTATVLAGPARWPGVHETLGKEVVELAVISTNKGTAVDAMRDRLAADAVLFLGDDVTDEHAFAQLRDADGDVGVKIGPGDTAAGFRVADPQAAVRVLRLVLDTRRAWLTGDSANPA
jgi:trehalose-phosphatase